MLQRGYVLHLLRREWKAARTSSERTVSETERKFARSRGAVRGRGCEKTLRHASQQVLAQRAAAQRCRRARGSAIRSQRSSGRVGGRVRECADVWLTVCCRLTNKIDSGRCALSHSRPVLRRAVPMLNCARRFPTFPPDTRTRALRGMECQTLPSTSSLSGASADAPRSGASALPRRAGPPGPRRRLPKAAVFILRKDDRELRAPPSPLSLPPTPPPLPLPPPELAEELAETTGENERDGDEEPASPLPLSLRGRVRLLSRDLNSSEDDNEEEITDELSNIEPDAPPPAHRAWYRSRASPAQTLCVRGVRDVGSPVVATAEHGAMVAISVQAATCAYDEFVSAPKNTMWKRLTRRFKSSFASSAPRPTMPSL